MTCDSPDVSWTCNVSRTSISHMWLDEWFNTDDTLCRWQYRFRGQSSVNVYRLANSLMFQGHAMHDCRLLGLAFQECLLGDTYFVSPFLVWEFELYLEDVSIDGRDGCDAAGSEQYWSRRPQLIWAWNSVAAIRHRRKGEQHGASAQLFLGVARHQDSKFWMG
jgi:hypothetical protein